jgi:choloylglycine hydrolase
MGALGLPGDSSSASRFVRAAFTKLNSVSGESENESVNQFFHVLGTVSQTRGCVRMGDRLESTVYTSCCNADRGIYYYTTYENSQITGIRLHGADLGSNRLVCYPLVTGQQVRMEN